MDNEITPQKKRHPKLDKIVVGLVAVATVLLVVGILVALTRHKPAPLSTNAAPTQTPSLINITGDGFSPQTVTVKVGQAVSWVNHDTNAHLVAADPYPQDNSVPGLKSQHLTQNQTYTFVFDKAGSYAYHDGLNPATIKGVIIVK